MAISHHHNIHHHLRHRHAEVAKPVLTFQHGDATSLTWQLPNGSIVTVDYSTAHQLCELNDCHGS